MKYTIKIVFYLAAFLLFFSLPVSAAAANLQTDLQDVNDIYQASGSDDIYDSLDNETKELLNDAGVDSVQFTGELDGEGFLASISETLRNKLFGPMKTLATIITIVIICRLCGCFDNQNLSETAGMVGGMASAVAIITPIIKLMAAAKSVIEVSSAFLLTSVPVYAGLMIASGSTKTGASYSALALGAANTIPVISSAVVFPLLNIFLAFAVTSSVSSVNFTKLTDSLYNFLKWLLILLVTVFSAAISIQTFLNSNIDVVVSKTTKLIASSTIPIVGGALSDSIAAIQGSVNIVKSGLGAFGVLATIVTYLPVIIETIAWLIVCSAGEMISELFEMPQIGKFMKVCTSVSKMILAIIVSTMAALVVCASIVIVTKGGV